MSVHRSSSCLVKDDQSKGQVTRWRKDNFRAEAIV